MFGFAGVIVCVAIFGFLTLRHASERRFAISIHTIPEAQHADIIDLDKPLVIRIDKRSAGRSPLMAYAMLLDGEGHQISPTSDGDGLNIVPLTAHDLGGGKRKEDVELPALAKMPSQRLLAAIVMRLPDEKLQVARPRIVDALGRPGPKGKSSLANIFSRILYICRELGGHAELTQVEVRDRQ